MVLIAVGLLALSVAPAPQESPRTAVLVESTAFGEGVAAHWKPAFEKSLADGLGGGELGVVRAQDLAESPPPCSDNACSRDAARAADAQFAVRSSVTLADEDTLVHMTVVAARDGDTFAEVERRCELCGQGEVVQLIELEATRLRAQLEAFAGAPASVLLRSVPAGARVTIDGAEAGTTPLQHHLEPGHHVIELRLDGHAPASLQIDAVSGVEVSRTIQLTAERKPSVQRRGLRASGGVLLGVGLAGVAVGGVLIGIHGRPYDADCQADITGRCRFTYDTLVGGGIALGTGLALAVVGSALLGVSRRHRQKRATDRASRLQRILRLGRVGVGSGTQGRWLPQRD